MKMASDEESDFEASDQEGEEEIIQSIDDSDTEIGDNEDDDDAIRDEKLKLRLKKLKWSSEKPKRKRGEKDKYWPKKVLFSPSTIISCFNQFLTSKLKEVILKYSNLKGM